MLGDGDMYQPEEEKKPEVAPSEVLLKLLDDAQNEKARLLSIIESQQRTIERLTELTKKADVHRAEDVTSAAVG